MKVKHTKGRRWRSEKKLECVILELYWSASVHSGMQEVRVSAMKWRTAREETREQVGIHAAEKTR